MRFLTLAADGYREPLFGADLAPIWFSIFHIFLPPGFLPDHMPQHPGAPGKLQAYAFGYDYIKALIDAANSQVS